MPTSQIFVNLPVTDIKASTSFYEALGFALNPDFSDEDSAYVIVSEHIALQLATHEKFRGFTGKAVPDTGGLVLALGADSREEVDRLTETALRSGGSPTKETTDLGWLYNRGFADPDGHHFEAVFFDTAATASA